MDKSNETDLHAEMRDAIIELGVASIETQGFPVGIDEPLGYLPGSGISES